MALSKAGKLRDRGFSLIELLVVCSILSVLAYVAWGGYGSAQQGAEDEIAQAELRRLANALKRFKVDTGHYPGQGPFVLATVGTTETANGSSFDCTPLGGVLRSWAAPNSDADRDAWFDSPINLALLYEAPALCGNHPLSYLNRWNPDTRRGWNGPYLDLGSRKWVDHGVDFNADIANNTSTAAGAPYGNGSPIVGSKILDIPAFGNGPRFRSAGPGWTTCSTQSHITPGSNCMLGWRVLPRESSGYTATAHELTAHARPFAVFGLADNDHPRVIYFGRDGRYGGRNLADACLPNLANSEGLDDVVICLGN